jgi:ion channel-forming bestrophin family protein
MLSSLDTCLLLQVLSELVQAADISSNQRWQLHSNLTELNDLVGGCERLLRTPIPIAYTRHTSRFLIIWLTVLPFALFPKFGAGTLVVAPVIAVLLAGINEIGIDVEEPFSLLPLEVIADRCNTDCNELISTQVRTSCW